MDIREAIKYWIEFCKEIGPLRATAPNDPEWDRQEEATNLAIKALVKALPLKPINGLCPECKEILSIQSYHGEIIANRICYYCPTCGQRIKWEE